MKNSRVSKLLIVSSFVVGMILGGGVLSASATTTQTTVQHAGTVSGYCYYGQSQAYSTPGAAAIATARPSSCSGSAFAPNGYMGAQSIEYFNGNVCNNAGPSYNSSPATAWTLSTFVNCGHGDYMSKAYTWMYNSSTGSYQIGVTTVTPIVTY